jgi:DNA modification methylase
VDTSSAAVRALLEDLAKEAGLGRSRPLRDPDEAPPPPEVPESGLGDLWALGEHRLLCGDSTSADAMRRLMGDERANVVWTDPPYGVNYVGKTARGLRIAGDSAAGLRELLHGAFTAVDSVIEDGAPLYVAHPAGALSLTFGEAFVAQGWRLHQTLVWVKDQMVLGHADYHYRHEPLLYGYKPAPARRGRGAKGWYGSNAETSVFEIPRPAASREHPTAKPVELIKRCLANSSREGDIVLDPFAGSGSTLAACEVLDRRSFSLEVDPRYADVIVKRWEALTGHRARRLSSGGS